MKVFRSTVFLIVLFLSKSVFSQYQPMLNEGSEWHHYFWFEASCNHHLIVSGDTIINDIEYKKIINQGDICNYPYFTFAREDSISKQVYYLYPDTTEIMIYDFSLLVGDKIKSTFQYYPFEMVVDSISTNLLKYSPCFLPPEIYLQTPKIFYLSHVNCLNCKQVIWIEGIGNISNPFYSYTEWNAGTLGDALLCHIDKTGFRDYHYIYCEEPKPCQGPSVNTKELTKEVQIKLYPNPAGEAAYLEIIDTESAIVSIEFYNSGGMLLSCKNEIFSNHFDISEFNSGLIFVVIRTKKGEVMIEKWVKK